MKIKNITLFVLGIIVLIVGCLAYFSNNLTYFDIKVYGIVLFVLGLVILIESFIGSSKLYTSFEEKLLIGKKRKTK